MRTMRWSALTAMLGLAMASSPVHPQQQHMPRGQPTIVSSADVAAVMITLGEQRNIDKLVRTVDTKGPAGNISIAAVAYNPGPQDWNGTANEHSMITEVFHVTKGSATFVFGGDLADAREFDTRSEAVQKVFGPGRGGKVSGHRIVKARVGDNVVLPPHTPHQIIEVTEDFEMLVIRIDPAKVLHIDEQPAAAVAPPHGPWVGTWKRNAEKSTNAMSGSPILKMWVEGDGLRYTIDSTSPTGTPLHAEAFVRFDGKPYPEIGNPMADYNVFTRVDDRTYSLVDIKDGKETFRFTITISPDGKTRTSVSKSRNAQGEEVTGIGVWDRIE